MRFLLPALLLVAAFSVEAAAFRKWWSIQGQAGFQADRNINRLLVNSAAASHRRRPDVAYRTGGGLSLRPVWTKAFRSQVSYDYAWNDYRENSAFDYGAHSVSLDVYPSLGRRLSLEGGADGSWTFDRDQTVAENGSARLGLIWSAPFRAGVRAGFEYRRDNVRVNAQKDALSRIAYVSIQRGFLQKQRGFLSWRLRHNRAAGAPFSYRSNSVTAGVVNPWNSRFRMLWLADFADKAYVNWDSRFRRVRRDKTYSGTVKATVSMLSFVDLYGSYNYVRNDSNVEAKDHGTQVYASGLEVKF